MEKLKSWKGFSGRKGPLLIVVMDGMGIGKQDPSLRQPVNVGRLGVGMPAVAANPVVHVVERNEQHISLDDVGRPLFGGFPYPQRCQTK